jgi:hypothetical protein
MLTTLQLRSTSERRLRQEGVSPAAAERGVEVIVKGFGRQRTDDARTDPPSSTANAYRRPDRRSCTCCSATPDGMIVRGPIIDGEHAFALAAAWLGERPKIDRDRDRALAELARRYLVGYGPADARDLAKWTQLPLRDARAGLIAISSELRERHDGRVDVLPRGSPTAPSPRRDCWDRLTHCSSVGAPSSSCSTLQKRW